MGGVAVVMDPLARIADRLLLRGRPADTTKAKVQLGFHRLGFRRGYTWGVCTSFGVVAVFSLLSLLAGCALTDEDGDVLVCGDVVEVSLNYTTEDDVIEREPCYDTETGGDMDVEDCCPEGYAAAGLTPDGTGVVCVQECAS
jgi:hypothetical protein